jgi:DNA modification methylase
VLFRSKGKLKTFNPIKEKKLYKDNRITKSIRRNKDDSLDIGFIGQKDDKIKGNVWDISVGGGKSTLDKIAFKHPAVFPESLAHDHIISWSNEGDTVLDPFIGSGTVGKQCEILKRNWVGIEINEEYCDITKQRIEKEISQLKLF